MLAYEKLLSRISVTYHAAILFAYFDMDPEFFCYHVPIDFLVVLFQRKELNILWDASWHQTQKAKILENLLLSQWRCTWQIELLHAKQLDSNQQLCWLQSQTALSFCSRVPEGLKDKRNSSNTNTMIWATNTFFFSVEVFRFLQATTLTLILYCW